MDKQKIDLIIKDFFNLFITKENEEIDLQKIYKLFILQGIIIKNCESTPEINSLHEFIEPREKLLNSGELKDFYEEEIYEETNIFGNIAQRFSVYKKVGLMNDEPFEAKGMKVFQFIKINDVWKITSMAWDDEREGFSIPEKYL